MQTLREILDDAARRRAAVGHFNVCELATLKAIVAEARACGAPVLIGASEGERDFIGTRQLVALVRSLREDLRHPIFVNADHTRSLPRVEEAARAGFDEIMFDASDLPFEENVEQTRRAVRLVREIDPAIVVEAEIGYIGTSSAIHADVPDDLGPLTTPQEARRFVEATGVDVLAPAVGTMHGLLRTMVRGEAEKRLDVERIAAIARATPAFLTLHGGSGTNPDDLRCAVAAGIRIVHVNTDLRVAWRRGLETALAEHPAEIAPYELLPAAVDAVRRVVRARIELLGAA
jgi:fructose-bisphosphate aldolase class II